MKPASAGPMGGAKIVNMASKLKPRKRRAIASKMTVPDGINLESEVVGVGFHHNRTAWAAFKTFNGRGHCKYFTIKKFLTPGVTFQQACSKAYELAVKARQEMDAEPSRSV